MVEEKKMDVFGTCLILLTHKNHMVGQTYFQRKNI